ncbi:MAG: hypothetical protein ACFKPT_11400 [Gloeotrichia echinulata GP01]
MVKVILTCNTELGTGGQGGFLAHAAAGLSELSHLNVFSAGSQVPHTKFPVYPLGYSDWSRRILTTPLLRRRYDLAVLLSDLYFDQQVSKKIQSHPYDLIVGVAGQTHLAFEKTKKKLQKLGFIASIITCHLCSNKFSKNCNFYQKPVWQQCTQKCYKGSCGSANKLI